MVKQIGLAVVIGALVFAIFLAAFLAITPGPTARPALAAGALQAATDNPNSGIAVSGTGIVRVVPDIATSSIGIEVTSATLAEASSQANTSMSKVIDAITGLGVDPKDIQTTNYSVSPVQNDPQPAGGTPKITGYRVSNQVRVTVRKLEDLGKILDAAVGAGANSIFGISFNVADPTSYQQQARAAAVKDAQTKAAQLAQAGGITLGKIVSIDETQVSTPYPRAAAAPLALSSSAVPVETGQLEVDVSVQVRFAIQ
jgi:uncharacterized protein YggE